MYYFFFLPIGTELPVRRFPFAVASLALINTAYFILFHYSPSLAGRMGALALDTAHPTLLTTFSACFLHADWFHLLGNLAYLLTFGPALEDRIGSARFLILYLACGMGAMLAQVEVNASHLPGSSGHLVLGASGAISGILGLFAVRCGFARVRVAHVTMALVQGQSRAGATRLNSVVAIGAWIFLQVVYALVAGASGRSGTAYAAHLGGAALGVALATGLGLYRDAGVERLWIRARRQAERGNWFAAAGETVTYLERVPGDEEAWLQLGRIDRILRRPVEAVRAYARAIDLLWACRQRRRAVEAAREMRRHFPEARLKPSLLLRLALYMERTGDLGWAANVLHDYAQLYPGHQKAPRALLRAAEIEARYRNDLDRAAALYAELKDRYPDSEEGLEARRRLDAVSRIIENRRVRPVGSGRTPAVAAVGPGDAGGP